jgi:hypothetical protein
MYHPTPEQADLDRAAAYEAGVPHGFVAAGDKYRGLPTITLTVTSELVRRAAGGAGGPRHGPGVAVPGECGRRLRRPQPNPTHRAQHTDDEYGAKVDAQGQHSGGAFQVTVSPKMRLEELRKVIRVRLQALPAAASAHGGQAPAGGQAGSQAQPTQRWLPGRRRACRRRADLRLSCVL